MEYIAIFALFGFIVFAFYRAEKAAQEREKITATKIRQIESKIQNIEKELVKLVNR